MIDACKYSVQISCDTAINEKIWIYKKLGGLVQTYACDFGLFLLLLTCDCFLKIVLISSHFM